MLISPNIYFQTVFEWLSLAYSLLHLLLKNCDFLNTDILQGSAATRLGCIVVGYLNMTIANFLLSLNSEAPCGLGGGVE